MFIRQTNQITLTTWWCNTSYSPTCINSHRFVWAHAHTISWWCYLFSNFYWWLLKVHNCIFPNKEIRRFELFSNLNNLWKINSLTTRFSFWDLIMATNLYLKPSINSVLIMAISANLLLLITQLKTEFPNAKIGH